MEIQLKNVSKQFKKDKKVLEDISFTLGSNSIVGLLGENGAGKTTLMDIVSTLEMPSAGKVLYNSQNDFSMKDIRKDIGYMPQEFGMYSQLSVEDNIRYFGYLHNLESNILEERMNHLLEVLHLDVHKEKKYKQLSGGMKRRVGLAVALIHDPDFLIIDEPTAGVDPEERTSIREFIMQLGTCKTVLFSTHTIEDIEQISDRVIILKKGKICFEGTVSALLKRFEGTFFELDESDLLPQTAKVIRRYKKKNGAKIVVHSPREFVFKEKNAVLLEATLENCYLVLNGEC